MKGVAAKEFDMSLEAQGIKLFWRDIPGFCRDIPEAHEKFEKKNVWVQFLAPMKLTETLKTVTSLNKEARLLHFHFS